MPSAQQSLGLIVVLFTTLLITFTYAQTFQMTYAAEGYSDFLLYGEITSLPKPVKSLTSVRLTATAPWSPDAFNKVVLYSTKFSLYNGDTGKSLTPKPHIGTFDLNTCLVPLSLTPSHTMESFFFNAVLTGFFLTNYKPSELDKMPTLTILWTYIDSADATQNFEASARFKRSTLGNASQHNIYPIRMNANPRSFRLSASIFLGSRIDYGSFSRLDIAPHGGWIVALQDPKETAHCFINSYEFDIQFTSSGLTLEYSLSPAPVIGQTVSLSCRGLVLSQKYPSEFDFKPESSAINFDAYTSNGNVLWISSVLGNILEYTVNPSSVLGDVYFEPHNKLSIVKYQIQYDGDVQGMKSSLLSPKTALTFETQHIHFEDDVVSHVIPMEDVLPFFSSEKTTQANTKFTFNYRKDILSGETPLSDFYVTTYGIYSPTKVEQDEWSPSAIATFQMAVVSTADSHSLLLQVPFVSEVITVTKPAEKITFYQNENNFKIDIINLLVDSIYLDFHFIRESYRFEGQFTDCDILTKNGKNWVKVTTIAGHNPTTGASQGANTQLRFAGNEDASYTFSKSRSYRIKCPNGVTTVRSV